MDVNKTRFHLVQCKEEWLGSSRSSYDGLSWDSSCGGVRLTPHLFRFPQYAGAVLLEPGNRRGAAVDRYGNWYWISDSGTEIYILFLGRRKSTHFWDARDLVQVCRQEQKGGAFQPVRTPPPPDTMDFSGLAVTMHHYLVVGVLKPAGLLIFDLHAGGTPTQLLWPKDTAFTPFDMSPAADGGVWILDKDNASVWKLDRYFRVEHGGKPFPIGTYNAVSIEAPPDGSVLIMESPPGESYSTIYHCRFDVDEDIPDFLPLPLEQAFQDQETIELSSPPPSLLGHDMAFLPADAGQGASGGTLYIAEEAGNQSYAFKLQVEDNTFTLTLQPYYYPMRNYKGRALVAGEGNVYYDMGEQWLPLTRMPRPRYKEEGWLVLSMFDGKEPGCVWHRLFIDADIPPGTRVMVRSYASDREEQLDKDDWKNQPLQPVLYLRHSGPELPYYNPYASKKNLPEGTGTWELLFQEAQGRYLHLHLTVKGPGNRTPYLYALRAYYPRFSYLKEYLPVLYREDRVSASFLDRFLANIEGFYTLLEGRIADVRALFDADAVGREYLDWLAGWFGVVLDPAWDETRRRLFLRHAGRLFQQRGTLSGLIRAVRLAIDPCPDDSLFEEEVTDCCSGTTVGFSVRIVEAFLTRGYPGVAYGDPTDTAGPGFITSDKSWTPAMGAEPLHARYRQYLKLGYGNDIEKLNHAWERGDDGYKDFDKILLPPVKPTAGFEAEVKDWLKFIDTSIGFTYEPLDPGDESHRLAYGNFLARRYQQVDRLNTAYQYTSRKTKLSSFDAVQLPSVMPTGGQALTDWVLFVSEVMPIKENAHRFTLLVPMAPGMEIAEREQRLEQVKRIVEIEKPAHTYCEVKPFWALFRVGKARLGIDTLPGLGSRFTNLLLGKDALAQSYLSASHPWEVEDRMIVGRDMVGE